jgi:hypothetical protein
MLELCGVGRPGAVQPDAFGAQSLVIGVRQVAQCLCAGTGEGGAVHEAEGGGLQAGQCADGRRGRRGQAGRPRGVLGLQRRADDVVFGQRGGVTEGGEQISAKKGPGGLLEEQAGVPAVWHVRSFDPAYSPAA